MNNTKFVDEVIGRTECSGLVFTCLGFGLNLSKELGVHSIADSNIVKAQSCSIVLELLE